MNGSWETVQKSTEGLPTLGSLSWWSIQGLEITHTDLEAAWTVFGLPKEWLPEKHDPRGAFIRACRALQGGEILVRKVADDDECNFAIVRESKITDPNTGKKKVRYRTLCHFTLNKVSEAISVTDDSGNEIGIEWEILRMEQTVRQGYDLHRNCVTSDDLRTALLDVIQGHLRGLGLRPNGGIYFTSKDHDETVEKISQAVKAVSPKSEFFVMGILDNERARSAMFAVMVENLTSDLEIMATTIEELLAAEGTRSSTLSKRLKDVRDLTVKAEMYEQLLSMKADELKNQISTVEKRLVNAMT